MEGPGWEMQEESERRMWDEDQALLAADPGYIEFLDAVDEWNRCNTPDQES
ncbi:MAG TPA: hypothetical protein VMS08_00990 [Candidatus Saccharimonadia bacterium]|nr:hypothetical protein [Candidatus Saccharimonadia bacterium]